MRGARTRAVNRRNPVGIIPADAGSTLAPRQYLLGQQDHPRGCGEHGYGRSLNRPVSGSSPRMRGARTDAWRTRMPPRDHPRGCGEHPVMDLRKPPGLGSSPRMRGARIRHWIRNHACGIIPADAGSTFQPERLQDLGRDHPRGCGEHCSQDERLSSEWGSSPRMRGAHGISERDFGRLGIIPADAGSTFPASLSPIRAQDHPRGCGEHKLLTPLLILT